MNVINEPELILRLQQDDAKAFDCLYYTYQNALFHNICKLTRDPIASEDILQETFIALWENRLSLDPQQGVLGWLFVVSYNKSVACLRKALKQACAELPANAELSDPLDDYPDMSEIQSRLILKAISQLSPQKRKVFELCKLQGKSYEETAKELDISRHTVKEYLMLSVQNIRTYIQQHPEYKSAYCCAGLLAALLSNQG